MRQTNQLPQSLWFMLLWQDDADLRAESNGRRRVMLGQWLVWHKARRPEMKSIKGITEEELKNLCSELIITIS